MAPKLFTVLHHLCYRLYSSFQNHHLFAHIESWESHTSKSLLWNLWKICPLISEQEDFPTSPPLYSFKIKCPAVDPSCYFWGLSVSDKSRPFYRTGTQELKFYLFHPSDILCQVYSCDLSSGPKIIEFWRHMKEEGARLQKTQILIIVKERDINSILKLCLNMCLFSASWVQFFPNNSVKVTFNWMWLMDFFVYPYNWKAKAIFHWSKNILSLPPFENLKCFYCILCITISIYWMRWWAVFQYEHKWLVVNVLSYAKAWWQLSVFLQECLKKK